MPSANSAIGNYVLDSSFEILNAGPSCFSLAIEFFVFYALPGIHSAPSLYLQFISEMKFTSSVKVWMSRWYIGGLLKSNNQWSEEDARRKDEDNSSQRLVYTADIGLFSKIHMDCMYYQK